MSDRTKKLGEYIGTIIATMIGFIFILPFLMILSFYYTWALQKVWNWYFATKIGEMSYHDAIGVWLIIATLHVRQMNNDEKNKYTAQKVAIIVLAPVATVLFARVMLFFV